LNYKAFDLKNIRYDMTNTFVKNAYADPMIYAMYLLCLIGKSERSDKNEEDSFMT